jgi:hypothetical protein
MGLRLPQPAVQAYVSGESKQGAEKIALQNVRAAVRHKLGDEEQAQLNAVESRRKARLQCWAVCHWCFPNLQIALTGHKAS